MEWQREETKPKNKAVIAFVPGNSYRYNRVGEACYISVPDLEGWYWADDHNAMAVIPTHWMPLPKSPAE